MGHVHKVQQVSVLATDNITVYHFSSHLEHKKNNISLNIKLHFNQDMIKKVKKIK